MMKTILLARHAKSDWNQPSKSDFERTLNARGETDADSMAELLQQGSCLPEQIISSDAVRALATANKYSAALKPGKGLVENHKLYNASLQDILQVIVNLPQVCDTVMLVGHNPGMSEALNYFLPTGVQDMPTCSVGIVQFDIEQWREVSRRMGEILAYEYPKKP
ncbi:MAG TPA: hypothetical protein ENJ08_02055 [Gammaproteobacteria bacterium]|nr:hypothetical protein [Gammaproteobacteria bacterium]